MKSVATIVERNDCVLLLRRGPTAPWLPGYWNLPGGHVEGAEHSADAAIRETHEETGLTVVELMPFVHVSTAYGPVDFFR
jgi:8-oxo-dGTP pyrophosphatase MutT (NUDIX family)